ncbi:MAG: hypothetical protein IJB42_05880 [Oscillospiraceae bacterium]|nr:hypothetical protein [Oscillospiraceae bacterium]
MVSSGVFLAKDDEAQKLFKALRILSCSVRLNEHNTHTLPPLKGTNVVGALDD